MAVNSERLESVKSLLSKPEALGILCFNRHHRNTKINSARISEMLKIPINRLKDACQKLEEEKIIKLHRAGGDYEIEILDQEDAGVKQAIDEVIWENKQEYGKIYKKMITAELLDFMDEK